MELCRNLSSVSVDQFLVELVIIDGGKSDTDMISGMRNIRHRY